MSNSKNQALWAINQVLKNYPVGVEFSVPCVFGPIWSSVPKDETGAIGRAFYDEVTANYQGKIRFLEIRKELVLENPDEYMERAFYKKIS